MAGGAVIDGGLEVVTMHNCSFIENTALGSCEGSQACGGGGAVGVLGNAVVHVEGSKFERNIAGNEGRLNFSREVDEKPVQKGRVYW